MEDLKVVHKSEIELQGDRYEVTVYCREDGKHFAETHFTPEDIIIHDGDSLEEVLQKHEKLLPLAITSRRVVREVRDLSP